MTYRIRVGLIFLTITLVLGSLAAFALGLVRLGEDPPIDLTLASPDGSYTVRLSERAEVPRIVGPFEWSHGDFLVSMSVLRNDEPAVADLPFYSGDSFDDRFGYRYPAREWLSDSVLQFEGKQWTSPPRDVLRVVNETDQTLTYFGVHAVDLTLAFDVEPGAALTVPFNATYRPNDDLAYVGCSGQFADGRPVSSRGVDFVLSERGESIRQTGATYTVTIRSGGVEIARSPEARIFQS